MKKFVSMIIILAMIISTLPITSAFAADDIKVVVKDIERTFDQMPVIVDGRTLVPMRGIFEALGAAVFWDDTTKSVTGKKGGKTVTLTIGETTSIVDGEFKTLDVAPQIINGRTMVPVRFISEALGEDVSWDGNTKTVTVGTGKLHLDKIKNPVHRPVPTEFTKSNRLDDLIYYDIGTGMTKEQFEQSIPDNYTTLVSPEDLFAASWEIAEGCDVVTSKTTADGVGFLDALRVEVNSEPEKEASVMLRFKKKIEGMKDGDACMLEFMMRCVEPVAGTTSSRVKIQVEQPVTWKKALFENFYTSSSSWKKMYCVFTGIENCETVAIRFGFGPQIVEIGDFKIKNFGQGVTLPQNPETDLGNREEFRPDAEWRAPALERIEKIRKGDFNIIVKDKDGNVIPDAEVELDMFDHEFQFGSITRSSSKFDSDAFIAKEFNAAVRESDMKWGMYKRDNALNAFEKFYNMGLRHFRGHSIIFEKITSGRGNLLIPEECGVAVQNKDKAMLDKLIQDHINSIMPDFDKYVTEWDVENEMLANKLFREAFGEEYLLEIYKWAREADPDGKLYYNENAVLNGSFETYIKKLVEMGVDLDGVGLQSHYDTCAQTIADILGVYTLCRDLGLDVQVTEFTINDTEDEEIRASYARDVLIASFSHEAVTGFYLWGFAATSNDKHFMLNADGTPQKGLEQWEDLIYNKWWTRDAKATTDESGKATIRGFYGDYDVTVTANGKTVIEIVAFHKGYNNTLEITVE
ncbi:MAG: hypothetical protein E7396_01375 [Ruminococcaceae bacterium]|nr:hypothetical protein [Oscillospiraceae bacterium]